MEVILHPHARARLIERFVTVTGGERVPEKFGRVGFRRHFSYGHVWRGKRYATKQVEAIAVEEASRWVVITVIARYF